RLAELIRLRDQRCRTPWCDAPVRHTDHAEAVAEGGPTTKRNGQGLCEACNHAKQAPGWTARPRPGPRHTIETITPTGHSYTSTAPPLTAPTWVEVESGRWALAA
ncbi:MAG: HNH endonuclease, partial [Actinomycetota bacterium]|nr:HNH endonuclease [Actinomycetota bacterium]